jgi:catalase
VPASYAQSSYHAEHAFRFTSADDAARFGRYHWLPETGESYLSAEEGGKRGANFLRDELGSARGPRRSAFASSSLSRAIPPTT